MAEKFLKEVLINSSHNNQTLVAVKLSLQASRKLPTCLPRIIRGFLKSLEAL